jgi:hypothetical protein
MFTRARHWSLYWARWIQSTLPSYFSNIDLRLSFQQCLPSGLILSGFPLYTLCAFIVSLVHATCPAHLILFELTTLIICGLEHRLRMLFDAQFSPVSCHFFSLRSKYSPQHPVLRHSICFLFSVYNYDSRRRVMKWNIIRWEFLQTLHFISNFMTIICVL